MINNIEYKNKNLNYIILKNTILYLIMFLCIFLSFKDVLEVYLTSIIKYIPSFIVLIIFIYYSFYNQFKYKFLLFDYFFLLFILSAAISTLIINKLSLYTYIYQLRSIFLYYFLYFIIRNFHFNIKDIYKLLTILKTIVYLLFIFVIFEIVFNKNVFFPTQLSNSLIFSNNFGRAYSLIGNPNTYAAFVVVVLFVVLYYQIIDNDNEKYNNLVFFIICISSIYLSMSRSAFIIIIIILILTYIYVIKQKILKINYIKLLKNIIIIIFGSLLIISLIKYSNNVYTNYIKINNISYSHNQIIEKKDNSIENKKNSQNTNNMNSRLLELFNSKILAQSKANGRLYSILTGIVIFRDYPIFGTGLGTYGSSASLNKNPQIYKIYGIPNNFYADNQYISILVETGIIGVIVAISFLILLFVHYRRNFPAFILFITVLWLGLFYNVFEIQIICLLFWVTLAINEKRLITGKTNE